MPRRNPVARALRTPRFRTKTIADKRRYTRKTRHKTASKLRHRAEET
jgi:hypothetical protein